MTKVWNRDSTCVCECADKVMIEEGKHGCRGEMMRLGAEQSTSMGVVSDRKFVEIQRVQSPKR
jgi:hypothetical protein